MTNAQIILNESIRLMDSGVLGNTGRKMEVVNAAGETRLIMEPEPIHTFAAWKSLGYTVKRGEHAVAKIQIWKCKNETTTLRATNAETGEPAEISEETRRMFMKTAHFFKPSQVERLAVQ